MPETQTEAISGAAAMTLQTLLWPEQGFCTERDAFMRLHGHAYHSDKPDEIRFAEDGTAEFNTAFNLFNIGKWQRHCALSDLHLQLEGEGPFELVVFQAMPNRSWERLVNRVVRLDPAKPVTVDLSHFTRHDLGGVLFFTLRALDDARLTGAAWLTRQAPRRLPRLTVSITTFRREAAVRATVARLEDFLARSPIGPHIDVLVVDNGKSAKIAASDKVTPIPNANLGGAGGFARGLLEAEARGATHCLFMDDDASITLPALERTWAFLAHATDPSTAVAAGLLSARHRWAVWENGAVFDRFCQPQYMGTDLRDFGQVLHMEFGTTGPAPENLYGGWWFFAFPVDHATYRPFPFFVRGDDVSFSLANDFNIVTLPGVISSQEADFSDKETPLTVYLDLRSHITHHLALPAMDRGLRGTMRTPMTFAARALVMCQYETLAAVNLAIEDVMRGPAFFAENADMADRRALLGKLRVTEVWAPLQGQPPAPRHKFDAGKPLTRMLLKLTLNGHLLPFFRLWGNRNVFGPGDRGDIHRAWGTAETICLDGMGKQYRLRHSKPAGLRQSLRFARNMLAFARAYPALRQTWQEGYPALASSGFWQERFARDADPATGKPA